MADQVITLTIPSDKTSKALEGFLYKHPNQETIADPEWVDPKDGSEAPQIAKYTDKEWIQEKSKRIILDQMHRGLQMKKHQDARIAKDETLITS